MALKDCSNAKEKLDAALAVPEGAQQPSEETKERLEREILAPWLRFLWETYRTVLEIIRTNTRLEGLYRYTCEQAFDYCIKFERTNEFRRLAELLRLHLQQLLKMIPQYYEEQVSVFTMSRRLLTIAQENVNFQLGLRFSQLNTAVKLSLWQEAYKCVEDIKSTVLAHSKVLTIHLLMITKCLTP